MHRGAAHLITTNSDQVSYGDGLLKSQAIYDGLGRTTESRQYETASAYIATLQNYDGLGRVYQSSNPYRPGPESLLWTTMVYDGLGRVKTVTTPDNAVVTTTYSGNATTVRDQANKQRRSFVDGLGRLTSVDEMLEYPSASIYATTTYGYDVLDDLTGVTQGGQSRTFLYDSLKRLKQATNPESGTVDYTYDENSNLKTKIDARSITTTYGYDGLNRVTSRTYTNDPQNTPPVYYKYDNQTLTAGYPSGFYRGYSTGRLVSVTYGTGSAGNYTGYDQLGRVNVSYQQTDSNNYGFGYAYNLASEMTSETYPSGRVVQTEYDVAGRTAGVRNQSASWYYAGAAASDATNRIQYASQGAISAMKLGNGKWEHTSFNNRLQPYLIGLGTSKSDSSLMKLDYGYGTTNNNGNVLSQTITIGTTAMTQSYSYDALNRLSSASQSGPTPANWLQNYGYDRFGNRWYSSGSYLPNPTLTPQAQTAFNQSTNRLNASQYDNAGNQTFDASFAQFAYDAENRQMSFNYGAATYTYDGDGRRVKKVVAGSPSLTTVFVYNAGGQLIAEYTSPDTVSNNGLSYLTSDHLGSTRVVTDINGYVKSRHDYLPFGEEIDTAHLPGGLSYGVADGERQKFTGKERDSESGLDYFLSRYYSSPQGRFTGVDPLNIVLEVQYERDPRAARARILAYLIDPRVWNRYAYAVNTPLVYIDPNGEEITISGGTDEQQEAVRRAITRMRDQSSLADQGFARFDGTGPDAPTLNITIMADKDFEAQITSNVDKSKAQGLAESGGITEDRSDAAHPTFLVNVNVSIRSSAINSRDDQSDTHNRSESRTEGILSHEVGGHAVDLSRNPREYQNNSIRDKAVPYQQRANERSANAASHRIAIQRIFGGHIRQLKPGLHWLN